MGKIKQKVKKLLISLLPISLIQYIEQSYLKNHPFYKYQNISFSQEGEDLVLDRYLEDIADGFYVDIGAHHPIRFSNTYKFYLKGWRGINIDAMPGCMQLFNQFRPNDINIEVPISEKEEVITFYVFEEPAYNTISEKQAQEIIDGGHTHLIKQIKLKTQRLEDVLKKYLSCVDNITFMTIDVEGVDLAVLKSNNWDLFRPQYILIESLLTDYENMSNNLIISYLQNLNYCLVAKTRNTLLFRLIFNLS